MQYIKKIDSKEHTVITVQVENEIGMFRMQELMMKLPMMRLIKLFRNNYLIILKKIKQSCFRRSNQFGKKMDIKHQVIGKKYLEKALQQMKYSWPGIMLFLQMN